MTLLNIFREPRREIIEQAIGIVVGGSVLGGSFGGAYLVVTRWFGATTGSDIFFGTAMFGMIALVGIPGIFFLCHEVGEAVCGALARGGIDPRPKRRY